MQTPLLVLEKARSISLTLASNSSLRKLGEHATHTQLAIAEKFGIRGGDGSPLVAAEAGAVLGR